MDGCCELNKVRAIYKPRKPPVEWEAEPPRKRSRPAGLMGLGQPAYPLSGPPRSHLLRVDSSHLVEFMSFTIALLWMSSSWAWSFGLSWRMDVHEWASNQHGIWSFLWALAFVFLRVSARSQASSFHAPNRPKTCKNEVPPKYMCICENDQ